MGLGNILPLYLYDSFIFTNKRCASSSIGVTIHSSLDTRMILECTKIMSMKDSQGGQLTRVVAGRVAVDGCSLEEACAHWTSLIIREFSDICDKTLTL